MHAPYVYGSYGSNEPYRIVPWGNNEMHALYVYGPYESNEPYRIVHWCNNEMHALYVLSIRTVSNSDGLYRTYGPLTALNGP